MFLDEVTINVQGGKGGDGCKSFRREKYIPKGGPDGGDGGNGGDVILKVEVNADTLSAYRSVKDFKAEHGGPGMGKNMHGAQGEDLILTTAPGTQVIDVETGDLLCDLLEDGQEVLLAKGGKGGFGNWHFKSSTRQKPDFAEKGATGEARKVKLELKLVANVSLVGLPSAGKSTLISVISNAKPEIGAYPFTTLVPNLGVVKGDDTEYVVCDVPGLIEGAHKGKGLGDTFLKHIERCGSIVHLLDASRITLDPDTIEYDVSTIVDDHKTIRNELESYSLLLSNKQELIVLSKIDLIPEQDRQQVYDGLKKAGLNLFMAISSATHENIEDFKKKLIPFIEKTEEVVAVQDPSEQVILQPHLQRVDDMKSYQVVQKGDVITITGKRFEQLTEMTDATQRGSIMRWQDVCKRIGLTKELNRIDKNHECSIMVGGIDVTSWRTGTIFIEDE